MAGCAHDHLLVFCDQQVIVRVAKEHNPHTGRSPLFAYQETVINDQSAPVAQRVVCENCGMHMEQDEPQLLVWVNRQTRTAWEWTLASKMQYAMTIRNLRSIVKELRNVRSEESG